MLCGMIEKCAAIILDDHRLLVVRKRGSSVFISPGGKIASGETQLECLKRELAEELSVQLASATPFGTFERPSAVEDDMITIHVWFTAIIGTCIACSEIEELRWISATDILPLGSVFAECVIPDLVRLGYLHA
jgi:8-oxo-dGTP pyrophosphatase MutT (NUDIX family)